MNHMPLLTEDEIQYICSAIPVDHVSYYFQRNPKEFAKILPGFRPTTISRFNVGDLLFKNHNKHFVSSFIEKHINIWLHQIQEHIDKCIEDGNDKDTAYIRTLSQSFFASNIGLYFKLIRENHSEAYVSLLSSAVKYTQKVLDEQEKLTIDVQSKDKEISLLQTELNSTKDSLEKSESKQSEYISEISSLKQEISKIDELAVVICEKKKFIEDLEAEIHILKKSERKLNTELIEHQPLVTQIGNELKKQRIEQIKKQAVNTNPLRPINMEEFEEFLGYNLENVGVFPSSGYLSLLKQYLCEILFRGMPIIINRGTGIPLMKCVANTLIGNKDVISFTYDKGITTQEIDTFLSQNVRIICLDGFLGNYNETELLASLERHRNKIIFLTLPFDRTLRFVPHEIFRYCHYLNLNRIHSLVIGGNLTEDPSKFEEAEVIVLKVEPDTRYSSLLKEIMNELGLNRSLAILKSASISNEENLCSTLAFTVLPYCVDVLQILPFTLSERLVKYAGSNGRCPYKKLFKEWFM